MASADVRSITDLTNVSPQYVNEITDPTVLKAVLKEHIDAVMGRYGKDLYAFDVVNEREWLQRYASDI